MNRQTAYWIVRKTGGGTAIEMAAKCDPPLTNREDFASHLSGLATVDKFLDRENVKIGATSYRYFVPMISSGKKGKNKKIIDPNSKGEKWFQKTDSQLKLQTIQYLNDNARIPLRVQNKSKYGQSANSSSDFTSDHDMDEIKIMQEAARRRLELKQCIRQILMIGVKQLLNSGEVIQLDYDADNHVLFKFLPYVSENYSLPEVD